MSWIISDIVKAAKPYVEVPGIGPPVAFSPWSPSQVEYYFTSNPSISFPDSNYLSRIRTAAKTWSQVQGSKLSYIEITTPDTAKTNQGVFTWEFIDVIEQPGTEVGYVVPAGKTSFICFVGESRCPSRFKVALNAGAPGLFEVYLQDSGVTWYSLANRPSAKQLDVLSIVTHELGHVLGLDHTNLANSSSPKYCQLPRSQRPKDDPTMCSGYQLGSTFLRTLASDDINPTNGLQSLYPSFP